MPERDEVLQKSKENRQELVREMGPDALRPALSAEDILTRAKRSITEHEQFEIERGAGKRMVTGAWIANIEKWITYLENQRPVMQSVQDRDALDRAIGSFQAIKFDWTQGLAQKQPTQRQANKVPERGSQKIREQSKEHIPEATVQKEQVIDEQGKQERLQRALEVHRQLQREIDRVQEAKRTPDQWIRLGPLGEKEWVYRFDSVSGKFFAWNVVQDRMMLQEKIADVITWRPITAADHAPEPLAYHLELQREKGKDAHLVAVLRAADGSELRAMDAVRLPEDVYIDLVKKATTTKDRFYVYEELLLDEEGDSWKTEKISPSAVKALRAHGREVCGINALQQRAEQTYGIHIETENWKEVEKITTSMLSIHSLEKILQGVDTELSIYPPDYFRNNDFRTLYLFDDIQQQHKQGNVKAGGFSLNERFGIVVSCPDYMHHELRHYVDAYNGGLQNENPYWATEAHGEKYSTVYGAGRGADAIISNASRASLESDKAQPKRPEGFANWYGKEGGIDEDQATVAEVLLRNPAWCRWALNIQEPALQRKIEMTKEVYRFVSNGQMDERFWKDFADGVKIDREYWKLREQQRH